MRKIESITKEELEKVNDILKDEYYYLKTMPLKNASDVEYQCFGKSHAIYSGYAVIKVYKYLKSIGIDMDPALSSPMPIEHPFYFLDGEHLVRYIGEHDDGKVVVCHANMDVPDTSVYEKNRLKTSKTI